MKFIIPSDMLAWLDENRGEKSRPSFILHLLYNIKNANTKREVRIGTTGISEDRGCATESS